MNQWRPLSKRYDPNQSTIEFKSDGANDFCFCIGGDLQNREAVQTESTNIVRRANEAGEFFIHIGDITHWATKVGWDINLEVLKPLHQNPTDQNKYFALPGNHEWQEDPLLERYNKIMDMPHNKFYYSIKFGQIYIINVTTGYDAYDKEFSFSKSKNSTQYQWFLKEVKKAQADPAIKWIIACTHYPDDNLTACQTWEPPQDGIDFAQACIDSNIDICYTGHNHIYERTYPLNNQYKESSSGTIFITTGGMGARFSQLKVEPQINHIAKIIENEFHFIKVTATKDMLKSEMINDSGKILDLLILSSPL